MQQECHDKNILSNVNGKQNLQRTFRVFFFCSQFLPVITQLLIVVPVILPPFLSNEWHVIVVTWYLIFLVLVLVIASMSTGQENSGYVDKFLR